MARLAGSGPGSGDPEPSGLTGCPSDLEHLAKDASPALIRITACARLPGARPVLERLLRHADGKVVDSAAWALAQGGWRESAPLLIEITLSAQDSMGVLLWSLARLGSDAARPLVLERLRSPSTEAAMAAARVGLATWAAEALDMKEALPALEALRDAKRPVHDFVRDCARDAAASIRGERTRRSELLLPWMPALRIEAALLPGESRMLSRSMLLLETLKGQSLSAGEDGPSPRALLGSQLENISQDGSAILATATRHGALTVVQTWPPQTHPQVRRLVRLNVDR